MFLLISWTIPNKQHLQRNYGTCLFHVFSAVKIIKLLRLQKAHHVHFEKVCVLYIFSLQSGAIPKYFLFHIRNLCPMCISRVLCRNIYSTFCVLESHIMFILKITSFCRFSFHLSHDSRMFFFNQTMVNFHPRVLCRENDTTF